MSFLYSSSAAEDSAVASDAPCYVDEIIATNTSGSTRFLHIFDSATLPADTTAPDVCIAIPAGQTVGWDPEDARSSRGTRFGNGCALCLSSTAATKTVTTGSEGVFTVRGGT
jgi:hypothetical protein